MIFLLSKNEKVLNKERTKLYLKVKIYITVADLSFDLVLRGKKTGL